MAYGHDRSELCLETPYGHVGTGVTTCKARSPHGAARPPGAEGGGLRGEESGGQEHLEDAGPHVPVQHQLLPRQPGLHAAGAPVH